MGTIANPKRGCGHMKAGAVYLNADVSAFGTLPTFVTISPAIPHQEPHFRGVQYVNGLALDHVLGWSVMDLAREISPAFRLSPEDESLKLTKRLTGDHYQRRLVEVAGHGEGGVNLGAFEEFWAHDMLDWVGESYYPTPADFIDEANRLGVNRRVPKGFFPKIAPGQTRVWFLHPKAVEVTLDDGEVVMRPGLIGYSYISRTIYTAPDGGQAVPEAMREKAAAGLVDIVDLEAPTPEPAAENGAQVGIPEGMPVQSLLPLPEGDRVKSTEFGPVRH